MTTDQKPGQTFFSGFLFLFTSVPPADDWAYRGSGGELTARQVLKRTVRFHVSLYFRIISDDRAQTYYRTNLCSASSNFPELSEDHRSRHSTGIELLAIDTFPRTVNDRCVSSPKINNLHCRTNAVLCNSHTCFFTVMCFWRQETEDDSIFFKLSREIPR